MSQRKSLDLTRWESGGAAMGFDHRRFRRYWRDALNAARSTAGPISSLPPSAAMTRDHIGPGTGVARNIYYYPAMASATAMVFGIRTIPASHADPPGSSRIKWDSPAAFYIVIDRAEDCFSS